MGILCAVDNLSSTFTLMRRTKEPRICANQITLTRQCYSEEPKELIKHDLKDINNHRAKPHLLTSKCADRTSPSRASSQTTSAPSQPHGSSLLSPSPSCASSSSRTVS